MALQYKKGTCYKCEENNVLLVKTIAGRKYCQKCNQKRLGDSREGQGKTRDYRIKNPTGELILFNSIWETREKKSFVSGQYLGEDMDVKFMAHVLSKGKYSKFRLYDKNIVLLTFDEHFALDHGLKSKLRLDPAWDKFWDLEDVLKKEYEALERTGF